MSKNPDIFLCFLGIFVGSLLFGAGAAGLFLHYKPNSMLAFTVFGFLTTVISTFYLSALAEKQNQN